MKRVFLIAGALALLGGSQALAADLPPPAAPPPRAPAAYIPPPVYNWTGFYIGGNLGAGWTGGSFTDGVHSFSGTSGAQFVGGGQVGANYEFWGGAVIGVEADFDWLANTSNNTSGIVTDVPTGDTATLTANNRWLTTVTGRLGYAFDRVLVYGKGGGAWVGSSTPTLTVTSGGVPTAFSSTINSNWGWTAGAGVEWAFWGTWSVRAEYDFIGLNNQTFVVPGGAAPFGPTFTGNNRNIQLVTTGINYKFGWGW
jgi:outer membrane immunogenic protein